MVYEWKVPIYSVSAQSAGEELERISNKFGSLTPEDVVEESKSENAVLHGCFEWDDQKAANKYRVVQASQIIRTITTKVSVEDEVEPVSVRAFVRSENGYQSITRVVSTPDAYQSLLDDAMKEMESFRQKYNTIRELNGVIRAMEDVVVTK